jgi:hypothetical protein
VLLEAVDDPATDEGAVEEGRRRGEGGEVDEVS